MFSPKYRSKYDIKALASEWDYLEEDEMAEGSKINFTLKKIKNDGSYGTEMFTLTEVTDEKLVLTNEMLKTKYVFVRVEE